jgi:predicted alpha/beta hydrolase family esterase
MKNVLILHGTENTSQGNWFPWLKTELEKRGFVVWSPDLPHADHPDLQRYSKLIFGNTSWHFNSDSIIIGHSSGGVAALKLLQKLPADIQIQKCIVVSASYAVHGEDPIQRLFKEQYDFEKIKTHAKKFIIFQSDDDPHVPLEDGKILSRVLNGEFVFIPNQGHFNLEKGPQYKQFPELLEKILE